PPLADVDVKLAAATLQISEAASEAEHGLALLAVGKIPEAMEPLRRALGRDDSDKLALRGLSQALAATRDGAREARALAERLVAFDAASVAGHEALLRA